MAGIEESPEDEYRRLKGYAPDHPVPISLDSPTVPEDYARNLDLQRYMGLDANSKPTRPSAGVGQPIVPSTDSNGRFNTELQSRFDAGASIDELRRLAAAQGREMHGLETAVNYRDRGGKGARFVSQAAPSAEEVPGMSMIDAARQGIGVVQSGLDAATLGTAVTGIGGPVAGVLTLANDADAYFNGNSDPFKAQLAALPVRFLPAGRLIQKGMIEARGATGILRDAGGRFRPSYLKHDVVGKAAQQGAEAASDSLAERIFFRDDQSR